jgi:hypothetical protein
MRNIEKLPLRNDAVFLTLLSTGKRGKISKPPRFTKSGQEPTRIVRTTEAFLYCDGLYRHLGLKEDTTVGAQIAHQGLSVRTSTTAGPNRHVFPETTQEDASETTLVMPLGDLRANLVDNVIAVLEPLFMLFNFKEFKREVYEGLVTDYAAGRVS